MEDRGVTCTTDYLSWKFLCIFYNCLDLVINSQPIDYLSFNIRPLVTTVYAYLHHACVSKRLHHFYFCNNFVNHEPILKIFGKKFSHRNLQHREHCFDIDNLNVSQ